MRNVLPVLKLAFSGSRFKYFKNLREGQRTVEHLVETLITKYREEGHTLVVGHGGNTRSVDAIVSRVAERLNIPVVVFLPKTWDRKSLLERNVRLVKWCDVLIAIFVDSISRGTLHTYTTARRLGKKVTAYYVDTVGRRIVELCELGGVNIS